MTIILKMSTLSQRLFAKGAHARQVENNRRHAAAVKAKRNADRIRDLTNKRNSRKFIQ